MKLWKISTTSLLKPIKRILISMKKGYKVICTDIVPEALERLSQEGFEVSEFDFRNEPKKRVE